MKKSIGKVIQLSYPTKINTLHRVSFKFISVYQLTKGYFILLANP